jgi:hypothetical protein
VRVLYTPSGGARTRNSSAPQGTAEEAGATAKGAEAAAAAAGVPPPNASPRDAKRKRPLDGEEKAARKYDEAAAPLGRPLNFPGEGQLEAVKGSRQGFSRFKGVSWNNEHKKWVAYIIIDGKQTHLGAFDAEVEAAHTLDDAVASLPAATASGGPAPSTRKPRPRI